MKQGRVKLCNCQILVCHVMTSRPSPFAVFVKIVSQLVNPPRWNRVPCSSAWIFARQSVCARPTSISSGDGGGTNTGMASIGATGEVGSETDSGRAAGGGRGAGSVIGCWFGGRISCGRGAGGGRGGWVGGGCGARRGPQRF